MDPMGCNIHQTIVAHLVRWLTQVVRGYVSYISDRPNLGPWRVVHVLSQGTSMYSVEGRFENLATNWRPRNMSQVDRTQGSTQTAIDIATYCIIPLWCTQVGLSPWKIKWNQGGPGYWPPKCKNEIRGVQPHTLRKEKIMKITSHPTEGFAKIKSRGSRNKIKKVPSQHPKCSRNKTEGVQGQPMCLWNQLKNAQLPFLAAPAWYVFGFPSFPITSYNKYCGGSQSIVFFLVCGVFVLAASFSAQTIVTTKQSIDSIYSNHTTQQNPTSLGTLDFIFPKIYQILNPNISKPTNSNTRGVFQHVPTKQKGKQNAKIKPKGPNLKLLHQLHWGWFLVLAHVPKIKS